ncbi:quinolinate synthetase [Carboxydothermus islandicus]|uniref:Quinolinate synthase n=1 Tax=Carboxydothermus islandicus TaxID=661089 RepID=A0A1L8D4F3_9THEO|nr:quinolinate synthase NadA [Carboxydothermus islandicus]GAV26050.1 quinolinate synthetase [Carboxydothermus islandicus]
MFDEKTQKIMDEVVRLKKEKKAIILAHLYQRPEVQEVADYVGDSLGLARTAAKTDAEVIVFAGVHFMAESAKILSPDKIVLLPEIEAGCPLADTITAESLRAKKAEHPGAIVVTYVNSSAEVKAESDIICTSANAVKVVESIPPEREIIFTPDRNLGDYVAKKTGRKLILWDGYCNTHQRLTPDDIRQAKAEHPNAKVVVHPECRPEVVALADGVFSTTGIINYVVSDPADEFIIGTEAGIMHQLAKKAPQKKCYLASKKLICPNMKLTTIEKVKLALETLEPQIEVDPEIAKKALQALERMLAIG